MGLSHRIDPFSSNRVVTGISIIIPVWNEVKTIRYVLEDFLQLNMSPIHLELIVVESNSTDGTRELLEYLKQHWSFHSASLKVIFQDFPRGKGFAVREGLQAVSQDIIVIFDADREYSPFDLAKLIQPIASGQTSFVLGSRTSQNYSIRNFEDSRWKSLMFNMAQYSLTKLFNLFYGTRLEDPFTMWKIMRAECIEGLNFVGNRFDIDWEILGKCIRRGVSPIEVPIQYKSRGFSEGKKVKVFKDGILAIFALFRFRFSKI